ncbi:MAG: hypothetical protein HY365_02475 [Candidatus Aenigmarchaeota archaeon]|nr:hypothetical protein [Candidatus Aenigmarchaeota archaeon]
MFEKHWKLVALAPLLILVASLAILAGNALSTGFVMKRDVDLTGGKRLSFAGGEEAFSTVHATLPDADVRLYTGAAPTVVVTLPYETEERSAIAALQAAGITGDIAYQTIGPAIGEVFWQQSLTATLTAFFLMSVIVFVMFRSLVPSGIVMLSALVDMTGTMAVMSLLNVPLSLHMVAALILIVAYSIDTDVLLTSTVLKFSGSAASAMKTGLTMVSTTFVALLALYVSTSSPVLQTIALVLMTGIVIDVPVTWLMNAGLLRMWVERRG